MALNKKQIKELKYMAEMLSRAEDEMKTKKFQVIAPGGAAVFCNTNPTFLKDGAGKEYHIINHECGTMICQFFGMAQNIKNFIKNETTKKEKCEEQA